MSALAQKTWKELVLQREHPMQRIFIEKVVVNIGVGEGGERLEKARGLLEELTGQTPSLRRAKRSIKEWNVKRGEPIAVAVTLRRDKAVQFLAKALAAVGNRVKSSSFDERGNVCFGIKEHILIPGVKYDPAVGVWGMDVCVKLAKPGLRVQLRRRRRSKVGKGQLVTKQEAIEFFQKVLGVQVD
ncbi:50S ribosomal protein L5 [Thermoproteus tenax]|uniref:Large ribosomal subunit protein uL5 n=1 Tax=Thermoproteus tenax (strain ATCC 35583 / DSM 2078 / JCM 9277 / NBRC 100435 / Kra 1) TaxID=768679 RepID=G4RN31_THETK|nr:50S ribosomal protein L5 [Thermoproteus tenax]CCC80975.1 50S ribosomal protein L5p [Thermoproteus tenax Kra 1]